VVNALIALALTPQAIGEIYNIGSTNEITIQDLALLVKQMTGSSSDIVFVPYEQAYEQGFEDMNRRVPALEKIHALSGFKPTLDVSGIIARVVEDLKLRGPRVE
jgi:UDP-glucose 4-epimerase